MGFGAILVDVLSKVGDMAVSKAVATEEYELPQAPHIGINIFGYRPRPDEGTSVDPESAPSDFDRGENRCEIACSLERGGSISVLWGDVDGAAQGGPGADVDPRGADGDGAEFRCAEILRRVGDEADALYGHGGGRRIRGVGVKLRQVSDEMDAAYRVDDERRLRELGAHLRRVGDDIDGRSQGGGRVCSNRYTMEDLARMTSEELDRIPMEERESAIACALDKISEDVSQSISRVFSATMSLDDLNDIDIDISLAFGIDARSVLQYVGDYWYFPLSATEWPL